MNRGINLKSVRAPESQIARDPSLFCKYSHRDCTQSCLEGYNYCIHHILEDKTSPYRQCAYITKAGRKCHSAAPKLEKKEGFCAFHTKKALGTRQRLARKRRPKETPDSLLEDLVVVTATMGTNHNVEPKRGKVHSDSLASRALEYASSSDSEADPLLVEHAWRDSGDSDAESIDSDQEDVLKYAGVYTTEEVAQILRDKLIRLQALYIDQFKRLKHILMNKRREYLQNRKIERELYGSIKGYKDDPHQRVKYEKLRAMKRYHKKFGMEALMQQQATQRRMKLTEGMADRMPTPVQCNFVDEGLRCSQRVVPLSKYCQKHILHDQNQVLYRPCPFADSQCGRPVPSLLGSAFCSLHQSLPTPSTSSAENISQEEVKVELEELLDCDIKTDMVRVREADHQHDVKTVKEEIVDNAATPKHDGTTLLDSYSSNLEHNDINIDNVKEIKLEREEEGEVIEKREEQQLEVRVDAAVKTDDNDHEDDDYDDDAHCLR